jgi:hypothetical protein
VVWIGLCELREGMGVVCIDIREGVAEHSRHLDRSMVRTTDFKSVNQGSIPCLGVFYSSFPTHS